MMPAARLADGVNRTAITFCVILATLMQALDTTIANVALPYMQGSVSASQDQIAWVLTSYIVAAAIMTPPTGYLAARFGLKRLFLVSVAGFTVASMLCGMSQSLMQIVLFRILQGLFGAALVPLSQTVLIDINPPERRGSAMALWGVAVMAGPVLGPVLGGWLTEAYSWRYVFYINLPIGVLAFLGMTTFLPDSARNATAKLDWFGFGTLSLTIAALQVMLDGGEQLDWFGSGEIVTEAVIGASALYLFLVHTFTAQEPFVRPSLFRDRNFTAGVIFIAIVGLTYYASLALQPPYLQNLMNYPIVTAGLVLGPRGVGTMGAMLVVGKTDRKGRYPRSSRRRPGAHGLVVLRDDGLDAGRFPDDDHYRRGDPGHWSRLYLRTAQRCDLVDAVIRAAGGRRRSLQSVAQHRLQRRHLGSEQPADDEHAGESRRNRAARHRRKQKLLRSNRRAVLESAYRRRTRRTRCHDHAAGADHCIHR
jgi:multidrug resistance protein